MRRNSVVRAAADHSEDSRSANPRPANGNATQPANRKTKIVDRFPRAAASVRTTELSMAISSASRAATVRIVLELLLDFIAVTSLAAPKCSGRDFQLQP